MKNACDDVREFSRKLGAHVGDRPSVPPDEVVRLRLSLLHEEFDELCDAITGRDVPGVADACARLIRAAAETAAAYGVSPDREGAR